MVIPAWLIPIITNALAAAGKWAAQQLCKKFMNDATCGGFIN